MRLCYIIVCGVFTILGCSVGYAAEGVNLFDFLMSATADQPQNMTFGPDDGKKFRKTFERKYGPHGMHLIESMGQGTAGAYLPEITIHSTGKKNGTKIIRKIKKKPKSTTFKPEKTTTDSSRSSKP